MALEQKFKILAETMDERIRRIWAAVEAESLGRGGIAAVSRATGITRMTIAAGQRDAESIKRGDELDQKRVRKAGAGRKRITDYDTKILRDLEKIVDSSVRGDPESPLKWTCKSTRKLAEELNRRHHRIGHSKVAQLLQKLGFSLQGNRQTQEGKQHPDRNAQFEFINRKAKSFRSRGLPVISVDTKKKELVGNFGNRGREWRRKKNPREVLSHDFPSLGEGKGIPYGVYDLATNAGWVSVGTDHDTAEFAVATIERWWRYMGSQLYGDKSQLLIIADSGGSNGSRTRLWKKAIQEFADKTGLAVSVCHFPPGTSKWNKIEHRLFSHITHNWQGRPLVSHEVMVKLIGATKTKNGLRVRTRIDRRKYPTGIKVKDSEIQAIQLKRDRFHGEWNYKISSRANV